MAAAHQVKLWSDNNFATEHYSFVMLSHFAAPNLAMNSVCSAAFPPLIRRKQE
jgi:hypothetical protein